MDTLAGLAILIGVFGLLVFALVAVLGAAVRIGELLLGGVVALVRPGDRPVRDRTP